LLLEKKRKKKLSVIIKKKVCFSWAANKHIRITSERCDTEDKVDAENWPLPLQE